MMSNNNSNSRNTSPFLVLVLLLSFTIIDAVKSSSSSTSIGSHRSVQGTAVEVEDISSAPTDAAQVGQEFITSAPIDAVQVEDISSAPSDTVSSAPSDTIPCESPCTNENEECRIGQCLCKDGFSKPSGVVDGVCGDINECLNGICGKLDCFNTVGSYICVQPLPAKPSSTPPPGSTTFFLLGKKTKAPTNRPTLSPSPTAIPRFCDDSLFVEFTLDNGAGTQRCVWLASRPEQQDIYCQPEKDAYDICAETCGACEDNCFDTDGRFPNIKEINGVNQTIMRDCLWLSLRNKVIEEVCQVGFTAHDVTCPETCGACDAPAPVAPPGIPSLTPSISLPPSLAPIGPVSPSISLPPSLAPIDPEPTSPPSIPANCDDVPFGTFPLIDGGEQVCVWLAADDRQDQRDIYCVVGNPAYDICEETCGKCNDNCVDTDQRFEYYNPVRDIFESRDCLWLSLRPHIQETECIQGRTVNDITCPETCNSCDGPEPDPTLSPTIAITLAPTTVVPTVDEPACVDTDGTFFYENVMRDCAWLVANTAVQGLVCFQGFTAYDITCPATCGRCVTPTMAPSFPPTKQPTMPPTSPPTTIFPSISPSAAFPNCLDTDGLWFYSVTDSLQTCEFLANADQSVRDDVCVQGFTVHDIICKRSCGNCP